MTAILRNVKDKNRKLNIIEANVFLPLWAGSSSHTPKHNLETPQDDPTEFKKKISAFQLTSGTIHQIE